MLSGRRRIGGLPTSVSPVPQLAIAKRWLRVSAQTRPRKGAVLGSVQRGEV